jgi:hypothetical protein
VCSPTCKQQLPKSHSQQSPKGGLPEPIPTPDSDPGVTKVSRRRLSSDPRGCKNKIAPSAAPPQVVDLVCRSSLSRHNRHRYHIGVHHEEHVRLVRNDTERSSIPSLARTRIIYSSRVDWSNTGQIPGQIHTPQHPRS